MSCYTHESSVKTTGVRDRVRARAKFLVFGACGIVLADALFSYLIATHTGKQFPINTLVLPVMLLLAATTPRATKVLTEGTAGNVGAFLASVGMLIGLAVQPSYSSGLPLASAISLLGCLPVYAAGRYLAKEIATERSTTRVFGAIGALNIVAFCVALQRLLPSIFPLEVTLWSDRGTLVERPAAYTDQNFALFYMLPLVVCMCAPRQRAVYYASIVGTAVSVYVLASFQTRSGIALLVLAAGACALLPLVRSQDQRHRAGFYVAVTASILAFTLSEYDFAFADGLIARFHDTKTMRGANGRLTAVLFLIEKLPDPSYWFPQGIGGFVNRFGLEPHCNLTVFYLEGGIISFVGWLLAFLVPFVRLTRSVALADPRNSSSVDWMFLIGGGICLVLQLTLTIATLKQPWLWGGLVAGAADRISARECGASSVEPD